MTKIYISSTYDDLVAYREVVYRTLRRMGHDAIAMEDYVASDERPVDKCLAGVAECDLYVGIFAWRYGYTPSQNNPQGRSITELEYRQAAEIGIDRLIFLLDEKVGWPPLMMDAVTGEGEQGKRIKELRKELSTEKTVSFFLTPDHLSSLVGPAVATWQAKRSPRSVSAFEAYLSALLAHLLAFIKRVFAQQE